MRGIGGYNPWIEDRIHAARRRLVSVIARNLTEDRFSDSEMGTVSIPRRGTVLVEIRHWSQGRVSPRGETAIESRWDATPIRIETRLHRGFDARPVRPHPGEGFELPVEGTHSPAMVLHALDIVRRAVFDTTSAVLQRFLGCAWLADVSSLVCTRALTVGDLVVLGRLPSIGETITTFGETHEIVDGAEFATHSMLAEVGT